MAAISEIARKFGVIMVRQEERGLISRKSWQETESESGKVRKRIRLTKTASITGLKRDVLRVWNEQLAAEMPSVVNCKEKVSKYEHKSGDKGIGEGQTIQRKRQGLLGAESGQTWRYVE